MKKSVISGLFVVTTSLVAMKHQQPVSGIELLRRKEQLELLYKEHNKTMHDHIISGSICAGVGALGLLNVLIFDKHCVCPGFGIALFNCMGYCYHRYKTNVISSDLAQVQEKIEHVNAAYK